MHPEKFKRYSERLEAIARKCKPFNGPAFSWESCYFECNGLLHELATEGVSEFRKLLDDLLSKELWGAKFSVKYLDESLRKAISEVINGNFENTSTVLQSLVDKHNNYRTEHTVLVPFAGITLEMDALQLGQLSLRKISPADFEEIIGRIEVIIKSSPSPDTAKDQILQMQRNSLVVLNNSVCAQFRAVAESERSRELALQACYELLDWLRLAAAVFHSSPGDVQVNLLGEFARFQCPIPILASDNSSFTLTFRRTGPIFSLQLTTENMLRLKELGLLKLVEVLEKRASERNSLEEALLRAMHWFGNSAAQSERKSQFLSLTTCCESLLSPKDREPISNGIAEGVALLLGKDSEHKKKIKKLMKALYSTRSAICHTGSAVVLDSELATLRSVALNLLVVLVNKLSDFNSHAQVFEWIEDQKMK